MKILILNAIATVVCLIVAIAALNGKIPNMENGSGWSYLLALAFLMIAFILLFISTGKTVYPDDDKRNRKNQK